MKKPILLGASLLVILLGVLVFGFKHQADNGPDINHHTATQELTLSKPQNASPLTEKAAARAVPEHFTRRSARERLKEILDIKDEGKRLSELNTLYDLWISLDAQDAIDHVGQFNDEDLKNRLYTVALRLWSQKNPIAFSAWIDGLGQDPQFDAAIASICEDPITPENLAIVWTHKIVDLGISESSIKNVLERWINRDAEDAVSWSLYAPENTVFLRQIFAMIAAKDPELALISFNQLFGKNNELIHEALNALVNFIDSSKMTTDALLALQLIADDNLRKMAMDVLMPVLGSSEDPLEIAQMINSLPDTSARNIMQSNLASIWSLKDPEAAGNFALSIEEGADKQSLVLRSVIDSWQESDIVAASNWLATAADSGDTDLAALSFTTTAAAHPEHIDIAIGWVNKIKDPQFKKRGIQNTVAYWYNYDEDAASHYLRQSGIFDEAKLNWFLKDLEDNKNAYEQHLKEVSESRKN